MGLYEGIKDLAKIAQQADNIELYRQLLDLSAQALDMQDKIRDLKKENEELKNANDLESRIVRHPENFITLKGEPEDIRYCAVCWGNEHKLIQLNCDNDEYCQFICIKCKNRGIYDMAKHDEKTRQDKEFYYKANNLGQHRIYRYQANEI